MKKSKAKNKVVVHAKKKNKDIQLSNFDRWFALARLIHEKKEFR